MILTRLKDIRQRQALSMRELSERSGVTPTTIVRAEKGLPVYSVTVRKLAKALGCTPAELRGDERRGVA
jgi:transcriptional regulator with XRE-family HTH domain